jgi:hypothetical protein
MTVTVGGCRRVAAAAVERLPGKERVRRETRVEGATVGGGAGEGDE